MEDTAQKKARLLLEEVRSFGETVEHFPEVLELFALTGVGIKQQVARAIGVSEREAGQILKQIASFQASKDAEGEAILDIVPLEKGHWKRRGEPPVIYRRGPGAAVFLRNKTGQDVRRCELVRPDQVVHALCIVDAALQLREMGHEVQVEQQIGSGRGSIRLDLLAKTPDGFLDVEVEQTVGPDHIPRIRQMLQERNNFCSSAQGRQFVSQVLVLFNVPHADWLRMQRLWRQAIATMEEWPSIEVWGVLLSRFGDCSDLKDRSGWVHLTDPVAVNQETAQAKAVAKTVPDQLKRAADLTGDLFVLTAFLQEFQEQAVENVTDLLSFARLIEGIAAPSLWGRVDGPTGAEMPRATLYMLRCYLDMHPELEKRLKGYMRTNANIRRGAALATTHIMGIVREFLAFFGLCPDRALEVQPRMPDYDRGKGEIYLAVRLHVPWPGGSPEGGYAELAEEEPARFEAALAYVLHLILRYPRELDLPQLPYL